MATQTSWRMRGDVMEACSCATTCPCNFGSDPTPLPYEVVIGWRIQDGNYGNTRLDGLSVVLYGRIPANVFLGNWTVGVYLDQRASQPHAQALGDIFARNAGHAELADRQSLAPQAGSDPVPDCRRRTQHYDTGIIRGRLRARAQPPARTAAPRPQGQRFGGSVLYGLGQRPSLPDA